MQRGFHLCCLKEKGENYFGKEYETETSIKLNKLFTKLEDVLKSRSSKFLVGDDPSMADIRLFFELKGSDYIANFEEKHMKGFNSIKEYIKLFNNIPEIVEIEKECRKEIEEYNRSRK